MSKGLTLKKCLKRKEPVEMLMVNPDKAKEKNYLVMKAYDDVEITRDNSDDLGK